MSGMKRDILIFGHAGYAGKYPENTLIACEKAFADGADGIEFDVRLTKDNKVVLIHDDEISRVSDGKGKVKDLTLEELRRFNFAVHNKNVDFAIIPTLEDVLKILPSHAFLNVEFKEVEVVKPALVLLRHANPDHIILSSFILEALEVARRVAPHYKRGVLFSEKYKDLFEMDKGDTILSELKKYEPYSFHLPIQSLDMYPKERILPFLDNVRKRGIKVIFWTCDIYEKVDEIIEHIDGIITNEVEGMVKHLRLHAE